MILRLGDILGLSSSASVLQRSDDWRRAAPCRTASASNAVPYSGRRQTECGLRHANRGVILAALSRGKPRLKEPLPLGKPKLRAVHGAVLVLHRLVLVVHSGHELKLQVRATGGGLLAAGGLPDQLVRPLRDLHDRTPLLGSQPVRETVSTRRHNLRRWSGRLPPSRPATRPVGTSGAAYQAAPDACISDSSQCIDRVLGYRRRDLPNCRFLRHAAQRPRPEAAVVIHAAAALSGTQHV